MFRLPFLARSAGPRVPARRMTRSAAAACVALLLGATAACGSGSGARSAGGGGSSAAAEKGAFPVTLQHKYGSTTLKKKPQRVVTVGFNDQDAALALGTVPVGTTEWMGGYRGAVGPWAKDKLGKHKAPAVLKDTGTGPQAEKIAALRPDVILALYAGLTKDQYRTLSKIAPVVTHPAGQADYGISWQQQTELAGKALGRPAAAKKLVGRTEGRIAETAGKHPEFRGRTAVAATTFQGMYVYGPQDNRMRMLESLGFRQPDGLSEAVGKEDFGANLSKERTDLLDNDVTVWIMTNPGKDAAKLHRNALYGGLKVAKEDREVFVGEKGDYGNSVSFGTVLSLPYALDRLVPQLSAAVDGKPSTEVRAPSSDR